MNTINGATLSQRAVWDLTTTLTSNESEYVQQTNIHRFLHLHDSTCYGQHFTIVERPAVMTTTELIVTPCEEMQRNSIISHQDMITEWAGSLLQCFFVRMYTGYSAGFQGCTEGL